jgi:predicted kinase
MSGALFVVCGEPGVGKTTIAKLIANSADGKRLSTDNIRKDLFGPDPDYTKEESEATYDEMFDRARNMLKEGKVVVLDATFMFQKGRERANRLAQEYTDPYEFTIVRVVVDDEIAKYRIRSREDSESDAGVSVYNSIKDRFEPIELPYVEIDNSTWLFSTKREMREKGLYDSASYYD